MHVKKARFQPVLLIPRVERQRDLLEQRRCAFAADGFIQRVEVALVHDFVGFFNPHPAQHAALRGDGGQFQWIIHAAKVDFLPRRLVGDFQRAFLPAPERLHLQAVNRPEKLCEAAVAQGAVRFADDQQVCAWVLHHAVDEIQCRRGAFLACAAAFAHAVAPREAPERAVAAPDDIRQVDSRLISRQAHPLPPKSPAGCPTHPPCP